MKVFVIIAHQNPGSFCHAIVKAAVEELEAAGHEVVFHDLYAEGFDPILRHAEIDCDADQLDPVVRKHLEEVVQADGYVVVHPNWWGQAPAILKGWIDRVLRNGFCYRFGPNGVEGLLTGRTALVLTTSNTPRDVELAVYGDPLENFWKTCVFGFCGVTDFQRRNFESIILSTLEQRQAWLEEARELVRRRFPSGRAACEK